MSLAEELRAAAGDAGIVLADLHDRRRIAVTGRDAFTFLQNLVTCDVRVVTLPHWSFGAVCTSKGRVSALFELLRHGDGYLLQTDGSVAAATLAALSRVIFRAKVDVADRSEEVAAVGIAGCHASGRLAGVAPFVPAEPFEAWADIDVTLLRLPGSLPRFALIGAGPAVRRVVEGLGDDVREIGRDAWEWLEIEAGVPVVREPTRDAFLPQFLDMDRRGGLSFTKGCYPGQEIVARTQHLGEPKRRLFRGTVEAIEPPAPGTVLRAVHDDGTRDGGTVVRAALGPGGHVRLLAVVPLAERESGRAIRLGTADGPRVALEDLD